MYLLEDKSVVEWCEAHTDRYAISPYISEMTNTISNLSFLYVAYLLSQQGAAAPLRPPACTEVASAYEQAVFKKRNTLFLQCNCVLVCVGLGSAIFHATETFAGEIADELPMSILIYYYVSIACHIHKWRFPRAVYLGAATLGWSLYLMYRQHAIFLTLFSCQLSIPIYITVVHIHKSPRQNKYLAFAFASIVFGKMCWLFERYLHTYQICPEMSSPLYLLHSFWHLGAAFGHYWIMRCWMS